MSELALFGGSRVFFSLLEFSSFWPPVDEVTARDLQELYFSRKWTAFHDIEKKFAKDFAAYQGAKYGVFTINGTVTLHCALAACEVGPGDEVIISPLTWYATAIAVRHVGATPVFVDIESDTLCIDPIKIEAAITDRTRAIIPVHAYGSMADMDRIMEIARRKKLRVIEDAAHMHGGRWNERGVGTLGDVGSFSFQQNKTMSSGEGGICITDKDDLADRMFRTKQIGYGMGELPRMARSGPPKGLLCYNFRATSFHSVILQQQLRMLDARLEKYRQAVQYLKDRLGQSTRIRFQSPGRRATRQGYFGLVMIFDDPLYSDISVDVIQGAIKAEGLPLIRAEGPIYRFILFNLEESDYRIDQPCLVTEHACSRILWLLHCYLGLDQPAIEKIADAIEKVMKNINELRHHEAPQLRQGTY